MITFPITYILLLAVTVLQAYRKERKRKPVQQRAEEIIKPVEQIHEQDDPLPACFTIEWDLENGGSKITVDE
jgi:hypothetical protein